MVRKKLAIAVLAFSALQTDLASALGLGNLTIKSALNQPLVAEIKLLDTADLDPTQIKVGLATAEDFQRAGVDRVYFLTNLHFDVRLDGNGGGVIRVTTREPVVEPYLDFVLDARWPNGRLLREYAMLLDPPTFSKAPATATPASAGAAPARMTTGPAPATERPPAPQPQLSDTLPAATKPGEYRIQLHDTLSKIATKFKPAGDVTLEQTMVAIQQANPKVFIRSNINLIKSGYILRLPNADEVRAISADQAAQDVKDQNHAWRTGSSGVGSTATASGPQLDARKNAPEDSGNYREKARLSIATAGDSEDGSTGAGAGSGKGIAALRNQLTAAQENLEKGKRDNRELQSRLDDMERQIATLQRLISLKDDQLAALQAAGANKDGNKAAATAAAAQTAATPEPSPAPAPQTPSPEPTPAAGAPAAQAPAPAPAAPKPAPKPAAKPAPQPAPGLLDQLKDNPLYGLAAAGVVALLGGLFVMRRRRAAAEEEAAALVGFDDGEQFQFDESVDLDNAVVSDEAVMSPEQALAAEAAAAETAPAMEAAKPVRSETGDAIAEADIYIAYGRYQQAVDLLVNAIDAEPARSDLRVKLLEVYLEMRNKDAFRQQFVALQGLGDAGAVAQVKDMLSSVDGVADWLDDLPQPGGGIAAAVAATAATAVAAEVALADAPAAAEPEPDLDLDLDFNLDEDTDTTRIVAPPVAAAADEDDFTLDLGDDLGAGDSTGEEELSFDLDLDEAEPALADTTETSFEFDTGAVETAVAETAAATGGEDELELDLGEDDLDLALSEMGDSGDLEDLAVLGDSGGNATADSEVSFDAELEDLSGDFDLSRTEEAVDLESEALPDLAELDDLSAEPAPAAAAPEVPAAAAAAASGDDFDFLADADEVSTKLDLARAYIDMGDTDGAKDILDEVLQEGTEVQKQEASTLLSRIA